MLRLSKSEDNNNPPYKIYHVHDAGSECDTKKWRSSNAWGGGTCKSFWGFQSESNMMTVSAAVRLMPRPPARVQRRKTNRSEPGSFTKLSVNTSTLERVQISILEWVYISIDEWVQISILEWVYISIDEWVQISTLERVQISILKRVQISIHGRGFYVNKSWGHLLSRQSKCSVKINVTRSLSIKGFS